MTQSMFFSVLDHALCNIQSFVHKQHLEDYQLWEDPVQKKRYSEYKLYGWPNEKQMEIYQFRKEQKQNLVEVHFLSPFNNAGFKQFRIFLQYIPVLLSSLRKLSFQYALFILRESLVGFKTIFQKYGYVHIDQKMIGLNTEGNVRVWMNQNFAYNGIAPTHQAPKWMSEQLKGKQMISTLFSLIEDRIQRNEQLKEFKKEKQLKRANLSFKSAIEFIDHYSKTHHIGALCQTFQRKNEKSFENSKRIWMKNQNLLKQPLTFKKTHLLTKRNTSNKRYSFKIAIKREGTLIPAQTTRTGQNVRLYSPGANADKKAGTRPRNRSQASMSIAESRAKTCANNGKFHTSPTKYFAEKSTRTRVESLNKDNLTLQSSLISRDMSFTRGNNHFRFPSKSPITEQFQFTQVQIENSKPNHKKRKFSAADQMTFHAQSANTHTKNNKTQLSLARSMMIKQKMQNGNRFQQNPQEVQKRQYQSKQYLQVPSMGRNSNVSSNKAFSIVRQELESHQMTYKVSKPFLNYKAIKNSLIKHSNSGELKEIDGTLNLKNSFLNSMDMKSSQIILERSSEYASLKDMMRPIKQSQAQTPMSDSVKNQQGGFSQVANQRTANLFITSVQKRRGSDTNISSSTTDRKSSFHAQRKEGLMNFTSPKNTVKSGMFKSIFVGELKQQIKQVPEGDIQ